MEQIRVRKGKWDWICNHPGMKGCENMESAAGERRRDEKVNGIIYDTSPVPGYRHGIVNNNINTMIKQGLKNSHCLVFMENFDFKYQPDVNDDYLCLDIMVVCDRKLLKGSFYSGVPKFIAETISPSTAVRDKTEKKDIYEKAGVDEYWIVSPQGSVEIYYLENGRDVLKYHYMLQDDKEDGEYNAGQEICFKAFPHIKMTLADIFEGICISSM